MSRRGINIISETLSSASSDKKDLKHEITEIGAFTLFFSDSHVEERWNRLHQKRHIAISTRFLFVAAIFQGLFFWSDCIERQPHLIHLALIRLIIGVLSLLGSFLVATGILVPTQMFLLLINLCYGLPSMALFYLTRKNASHWHSLFLVYGMNFFILPKISPLNFMYASTGAGLFTFTFTLISTFRLSFQQWLLSNCLHTIIILLFCYDSYSSEKLSRERWLLRDRLQREHINLRIVASSIQDDLAKTSLESSSGFMKPRDLSASVMNTLKASNSINMNSDAGNNNSHRLDSADAIKDEQSKRFVRFFKGLVAWGLVYAFAYSFDFISLPNRAVPRDLTNSAAFALLLHCMGFSIFLLYFTGQIRWLALNGIVSLLIMFIFNQSGMSQRWVIFSTHSLGYVLLVAVIIIMILVFGGVVLVWHHLLAFLKDVLIRYPQVKDDLGHNKLLESVLIRYIADMPSSTLLHSNENHKLIIEYGADEESVQSSTLPTVGTDQQGKLRSEKHTILTGDSLANPLQMNKKILESRRPDTCFFCLKPSPSLLVPACDGWDHVVSDDKPSGINMCTPYTEMVLQRDFAVAQMNETKQKFDLFEMQYKRMEVNLKQAEDVAEDCKRHVGSIVIAMKKKYLEIERIVQKLVQSCDARVKVEKHNFEAKLQNVIAQHNSQLTELKKQHKQAIVKVASSAATGRIGEVRHEAVPIVSGAVDAVLMRSNAQGHQDITEVSQRDGKSKRVGDERDKRLSGSSITVIAPKRPSGHLSADHKDSGQKSQDSSVGFKPSYPPSNDRFSSYSSLDSVSSAELVTAGVTPLNVDSLLEQDEFDTLWRSSLDEIQGLFNASFSQVVGADRPVHLFPLSATSDNQSGTSRMKYALSFQNENSDDKTGVTALGR